jgi:RNA binding exosome subunit
MAKSEIQSVEVSFLVHATEDEARLLRCMEETFELTAPKLEMLRGHYGNSITHVRYQVAGHEASRLFVSLSSELDRKDADAILENMGAMMDEHRALYLRLNKQQLLSGKIALEQNDPVRLKVKPRSFMIGRDPARFYARIIGLSPR